MRGVASVVVIAMKPKPKDYKLLKDLPFMKKGAIFVFNKIQNEKEEEFSYYYSYVKGGEKNKIIILAQDIVENCPEWFRPKDKFKKSEWGEAWYG